MLPHPNGVRQSLHTQKSTPTRTYRASNATHRIAAVQYGNVLRSERTSNGVLRNPPAIAFDYQVLNEANGNGCEIVQIYLTDIRVLYTVPMADYWHHSKIQTRYGQQIVLSLKFWSVDGQQPDAERKVESASTNQLDLFRANL